MGFVRLVVMGFVVLTVIFICVSLYSRSVRRERLEKEWDANPAEGADGTARTAYIEAGMVEYLSGYRRRLVLLIYVVPTIVVGIIIYVTNY
jgi:Ca2+/Na+ antiporter